MVGVVVPKGGMYLNTESGLSAPGGLLDRLTQAMDTRAQYQGTMSGLAPALQASGVPVSAPQGILSQLLGSIGLGGQQQPPAMPAASSGVGGPGASAPTMGGSAPTSQPTGGAPGVAGGGGSPAPMGMSAYAPMIGQSAQKYGIDPMTAIRVAMAEGGPSGGFGASGTGDGGSSFSPFQLHYGGVAGGGNSAAGLGDDFTAATGLDARDPKNAAAAIDFALADAAKNGWSKFHGAAAAGIGQWQGIGGAPSGSGGTPSPATAYAPASASSDSALSPAARGGASGGPAPMPIATAASSQPAMQPTPPSNLGGSSGAPGAAGAAAASASGTSASPSQVIAPLMANAATRPIGGALWQHAQQNGAMGGQLTLPAGMTPEALAEMISTPQTQAMGLAIWQKSLFPQITSVEPNRAIFRGTQYMGQSPSAPMDVADGHSVVNPNPGGGVIAAVPPKLEHVQTGTDAFGQPTYGAFNPQAGSVAPFQGTPSAQSGLPATGAGGTPTGNAFLSTLPPSLAGQVKAIAEGRMKMPPISSRSPMAARLASYVMAYNPSYDQTSSDARSDTREDFAKGNAAQTITAGNTALIHLGDLASQIDALGNADTSIPGNNYVNALKNSANSTSAAGAPITSFNSTAGKYVEEATKFYRGSGGTQADIDREIANLNANMSPTQLKAAIQAQIPLLQGKVNALQNTWHQGMGPQAQDYPILSPQAQAVIDRYGPSASTGYGAALPGLPIASPVGGGAPAGGSPQSGGVAAGPLDQARAAIASGAPRGAVMQRLQQMGINPAGL